MPNNENFEQLPFVIVTRLSIYPPPYSRPLISSFAFLFSLFSFLLPHKPFTPFIVLSFLALSSFFSTAPHLFFTSRHLKTYQLNPPALSNRHLNDKYTRDTKHPMAGPTIIEHDGIRYRVRVSVGTTASTDPKDLHILNVNDDSNPHMVDSDEFAGHVVFRIKGQDQIYGYEAGQKQDGLKPVPDSKWFENASVAGRGNMINCMEIVGRFKREWAGDQVVFAVRNWSLYLECTKKKTLRPEA